MFIYQQKYQRNDELMSQKQFDEHVLLYAGYIDKSNKLIQQKNTLPLEGDFFQSKTQEALNLNGVMLHEMYFENIELQNVTPSKYKIYDLFVEYFGSIQEWEKDFERCAAIAKGWTMFGYEPIARMYRNIILSTHDNGYMMGFEPLIVLDCYEHAYFIDFGADKKEYIKRFIANVNWQIVEGRFIKLSTALSKSK